MAYSHESVRFVGESRPDEDLSKATSKRTGLHSASPLSGDVMFSKYSRDYATGDRGEGISPSQSPRGTPASSSSKGKRSTSPSPGLTPGGLAKRTRASSLGTPPTRSSRSSSTLVHFPSSEEERGVPSKPSCIFSDSLYSRQAFDQEKEEGSSLALTLMRGVLTPEDRCFLAHWPRENLEKVASLHMMKAVFVCDALFSRSQATSPIPQSDAQRRKLEDKVECLGVENAQLKEEGCREATLDFQHIDEGRNFLEGYWASRVVRLKKSDKYKEEMAKMAIPFLEYGFKAYKAQFLAQGYLPSEEEPSFLDIGMAMVDFERFIAEDDLDSLLGEVEVEAKAFAVMTFLFSLDIVVDLYPILVFFDLRVIYHYLILVSEALEQLKKYLAGLSLLVKPSSGDNLYLYLSCTHQTISSILIRGGWRKIDTIYYASKVLNGAEGCYTPIENMVLALVITARRLCPYFLSYPIGVRMYLPLKQTLAFLEPGKPNAKKGKKENGNEVVGVMERRLPPSSLLPLLLLLIANLGTPSALLHSIFAWHSKLGYGNLNKLRSYIFVKYSNLRPPTIRPYEAVVVDMRMAHEVGARQLVSHLDSQLIVKQVEGYCWSYVGDIPLFTQVEAASGQKVNLAKSSMVLSSNIPATDYRLLGAALGPDVVPKHDKYLGLPVVGGRSKKEIFDGIRIKVWNCIQGWNSKFLSQAGKEILIKMVIEAIPSYDMPLAWRKLCMRKGSRGLGFQQLAAFNDALLANKAWRIIQHLESLVGYLYSAKYFQHLDFFTARLGSRQFLTWRSILGTRGLVTTGARWRVGDGARIRIWEDPWIPRESSFPIRMSSNIGRFGYEFSYGSSLQCMEYQHCVRVLPPS
ncbi:hypothetical protein Sango_0666200 [Sesamum angolense]|uniref:Reverse transcriptase/retrotransposon-derived protein RNase H-like domain-containing protein n=1 Tax=Sesamum angolense TaxID=2727404 RepID=A0AAE1X766_9LAMI|nr:hypothetical protein Sango_0666200 [Sesamum angolense]